MLRRKSWILLLVFATLLFSSFALADVPAGYELLGTNSTDQTFNDIGTSYQEYITFTPAEQINGPYYVELVVHSNSVSIDSEAEPRINGGNTVGVSSEAIDSTSDQTLAWNVTSQTVDQYEIYIRGDSPGADIHVKNLSIYVPAESSSDLQEEIMLYYSFDSTAVNLSNVIDLSTENQTGNCSNLSSNVDCSLEPGIVKQQIKINDENYVKAYDPSSNDRFIPGPNLSFALWIDQRASNSGSFLDAAFTILDSPTESNGLRFRISSDGLLKMDYSYNKSQTEATIEILNLTEYAGVSDPLFHFAATFKKENGSSAVDANFYVNGSLVNNTQISNIVWGSTFSSGNAENREVKLGASTISDNPFFPPSTAWNGSIDEAGIWNRTLSSNEISQLYNSGNGLDPYDYNIDLVAPENNVTIFNSSIVNFTYNISGTEYFPDPICRLYLNGTSVTSSSNVSNTTNTITHEFSIDGNYEWKIGCDINSIEENSTSRNITIDTAKPLITTDGDFFLGEFFFVSNELRGGKNILGNISVTDENLFSVNITTDEETVFNISNINSTQFNYSLNLNVSNYPGGEHWLNIRAADGHTTKRIPNYRRDPSITGLRFDFGKDDMYLTEDYVHISASSGPLSTEKRKDRYVFNEIGFIKSAQTTFTVTSDHKIVQPRNSDYDGHLVIPSLEKWIDFELENDTGSEQYQVRRINDKRYEVTVSNLPMRSVRTFKSIGDMNIANFNTTFTVVNGSVEFESPITETQNSNISLTLSHNTSYSVQDGLLTYDDTQLTPTQTYNGSHTILRREVQAPINTSNENANITLFWNYTILGPQNNVSNRTDNFNQSVQTFFIDECVVATNETLQFDLISETTNNSVIGSIQMNINAYLSDENFSKNFGFDLNGSSSYTLCLSPENATLTTSTNAFSYTAPTYTTRGFEWQDLVLNTTKQTLPLYLAESADSSPILIEVVDTNDNEVVDALVEVNRFFPADNEFVQVESERTDFTGKTQVSLFQDTVFYSFDIVKDGQVLRTIPSARIFSDSLIFIVDIEELQQGFFDDVEYTLSPMGPIRTNGTIEFSITASSESDSLEDVTISTDVNGTPYSDTASGTTNETATVSVNLTNYQGPLEFEYTINADGFDTYTFNETYYILNPGPGSYSLQELKGLADDVFSPEWRPIVASLFTLLLVVSLATLRSPLVALPGLMAMGLFAFWGWIPGWLMIFIFLAIVGAYMASPRGVI